MIKRVYGIWYRGIWQGELQPPLHNVYSKNIHRCKALSVPTADIGEVTFAFNRANFWLINYILRKSTDTEGLAWQDWCASALSRHGSCRVSAWTSSLYFWLRHSLCPQLPAWLYSPSYLFPILHLDFWWFGISLCVFPKCSGLHLPLLSFIIWISYCFSNLSISFCIVNLLSGKSQLECLFFISCVSML